jgi:hypothetical protein
MDQIGLALKLRRLAAWLDGRCQPDNLIRKQLRGAPFGDCYVTIDPDRQGPLAASFNQNRVYLCGAEAGMGPDSVGRLIELFRAEGVRRYAAGSKRADFRASGTPAIPRCAASSVRRFDSTPISKSAR